MDKPSRLAFTVDLLDFCLVQVESNLRDSGCKPSASEASHPESWLFSDSKRCDLPKRICTFQEVTEKILIHVSTLFAAGSRIFPDMIVECPEAKLEAQEWALLKVPETEIHTWHARAKTGDDTARDKLLRWAYAKARHYYCCIVTSGPHALTQEKAEEMAGKFMLIFERKWRQMNSVIAFTQATLKKSVTFRRRNSRSVPLENAQEVATESPDPGLNDEQWLQYKAYRQVFDKADPTTQEVVRLRVEQEPPIPYAEIARRLNLPSADAAKMRFQRYREKARQQYQRLRRRYK